MASSPMTSSTQSKRPNLAFRQLRGQLSPGEFAAAVRRAAREIGERVSCDARYVGRVEAGEIRCPNYAYERVFLHMFPGRTLADLGFAPRAQVRGRAARSRTEPEAQQTPYAVQTHEESDVRRRAFMTGSTAAVAAALGPIGLTLGDPAEAADRRGRRIGETEVHAVEEAVRRIRLLDDRHGADGLYRRAAAPLRTAYTLLDAGTTVRQTTSDRLHAGAGELAITVGWLAHDSGRFDDARSHYAEALATARVYGDAALEAHAFCNTAFLARDAGRPREAVRAAQAAGRAARHLGSHRLSSLIALREAGGWAGLGDRAGCEQALSRAHGLFDRGAGDDDPEWMSFFGPAELAGLEAQCWSALGEWARAVGHARLAASVAASQTPQFTRNIALYTAELADDLARSGRPDEAADAGLRVLALLGEVQSSRIQAMLATTARLLLPHRSDAGVSEFLEGHAVLSRTA
ncbi:MULTISPECIES: hypothetical protein [Streptomyces]|uniref:Transcriptional regulator n=1 Tax=Streptomyces venezuelae TaxID=54571 RepID=A0A5P2BE30_STRVZ|nr:MULTISPECIES: hypothetical protein [Streptomyces]NEB48309.1 hypothetical protein [Streptomyces sp. SID339]QES27391.1 hypothetical protein DEJ47_13820 [Streptomyces venezuelae]